MVEKKLEASGEENLASTACAQFAFGSKLVPFSWLLTLSGSHSQNRVNGNHWAC